MPLPYSLPICRSRVHRARPSLAAGEWHSRARASDRLSHAQRPVGSFKGKPMISSVLQPCLQPCLAVKDLQVRFMTREGIVHAINGISYTLYDGEVLGILGESGSGKRVSLRALVGLLPPGRIQISGGIYFE